MALAAVASDFTAFQHLPPVLKKNRVVALAAVKQSPGIFKSLPEEVKADREAPYSAFHFFSFSTSNKDATRSKGHRY